MYRLIVVCSLALACASGAPQGRGRGLFNGDPATAAILAETRQVRLDGSADVAYAQEDGVLFKETTSLDGERRGSYEFVGDDGELYRVEYTAGVGGFRVLSSTHVDATPDLPVGPIAPYVEPAPLPAPARAAPVPNRNFDFSYTPQRQTVVGPVLSGTTTTPAPAVRKNFHTGQVNLAQDGQGYAYTYTHTG